MNIARAPLRISFFGGGTDLPEYFCTESGAVLAAAIDKFAFVTASTFQSSLFDYGIKVAYRRSECVKSVDEIEHPVFRECLRFCAVEKDIELHTVADLPAFTGLGSSSTFTVCLLQALHAYKGEYVRPLQLAYESIYIERSVLREAVGCQDQTVAAFGGFNVIEFRTETDIIVHRVNLRQDRLAELEAHMFVLFTDIRRRAADIERRKIAGLSTNKKTLLEMRRMVDVGYDILVDGQPIETFGRLLHQAWEAKRTLEGSVSTPEIDELYSAGLAAGAWGGKLLGAGGGGFLMFLAPPERHEQLRSVIGSRFVLPVKLGAPGAQVIF